MKIIVCAAETDLKPDKVATGSVLGGPCGTCGRRVWLGPAGQRFIKKLERRGEDWDLRCKDDWLREDPTPGGAEAIPGAWEEARRAMGYDRN